MGSYPCGLGAQQPLPPTLHPARNPERRLHPETKPTSISVYSVCLQEESSTVPPSRSTPVSSGSGLPEPPGTRVKNATGGIQMTKTGPAKGVERKRKKENAVRSSQ